MNVTGHFNGTLRCPCWQLEFIFVETVFSFFQSFTNIHALDEWQRTRPIDGVDQKFKFSFDSIKSAQNLRYFASVLSISRILKLSIPVSALLNIPMWSADCFDWTFHWENSWKMVAASRRSGSCKSTPMGSIWWSGRSRFSRWSCVVAGGRASGLIRHSAFFLFLSFFSCVLCFSFFCLIFFLVGSLPPPPPTLHHPPPHSFHLRFETNRPLSVFRCVQSAALASCGPSIVWLFEWSVDVTWWCGTGRDWPLATCARNADRSSSSFQLQINWPFRWRTTVCPAIDPTSWNTKWKSGATTWNNTSDTVSAPATTWVTGIISVSR